MARFPDPRTARGDVVAVGDDLSVETLRDAYRHGIFPWPHDNMPLPWFSPRRRTVILFDELHVGRSLRKAQKRKPVLLLNPPADGERRLTRSVIVLPLAPKDQRPVAVDDLLGKRVLASVAVGQLRHAAAVAANEVRNVPGSVNLAVLFATAAMAS